MNWAWVVAAFFAAVALGTIALAAPTLSDTCISQVTYECGCCEQSVKMLREGNEIDWNGSITEKFFVNGTVTRHE